MEAVKKAAEALTAKRQELANIEAQIERAQAAIDAVAPGAAEIEGLQLQRKEEIGRAFIESREADVTAIDKALAKAEKSVVTARGAGEAATSALHILKMQRMQLEHDLIPLQKAEDDALTDLSVRKVREAEEMLQAALKDVSSAFAHMAAADTISRRERHLTERPRVAHRIEDLKTNGIHIGTLDPAPFEQLKAELESFGVEEVGVWRRPKPAPATAPAEQRPVTFTYAQPVAG